MKILFVGGPEHLKAVDMPEELPNYWTIPEIIRGRELFSATELRKHIYSLGKIGLGNQVRPFYRSCGPEDNVNSQVTNLLCNLYDEFVSKQGQGASNAAESGSEVKRSL